MGEDPFSLHTPTSGVNVKWGSVIHEHLNKVTRPGTLKNHSVFRCLLARMFASQLIALVLVAHLSAVQGRRPCHLTNTTISAEKDHCPVCVTFTTTICSGHCQTMDPVYKTALSSFKQQICTYKEIRYDIIKLPDCLPGTDPFFTYPVALSCDCDQCKMDYSDCTVESSEPDVCMKSRLDI